MNLGQSLFAQLMDHLPTHEFRKCVQRYGGNYRVRSFSCWDQFLCMAFCPADFPREPARHRRLPAFAGPAALSPGHSRHGVAQHSGRCQRKPRLAYLCRLRHRPDRAGAGALRPRGSGTGPGQHGVRPRLHHHRSLHDVVSLGALQVGPARRQAAYAARSARLHPHVYPGHSGAGARRESARCTRPRGGRFT
jgi:hypothetical protein